MTTFFPPLRDSIEDERSRPERSQIYMPRLTMEEVEQKVLAAKPGKAAGGDGLPAVVWKESSQLSVIRSYAFPSVARRRRAPLAMEKREDYSDKKTKQRGLLNCESMETHLVTVNLRGNPGSGGG